MLGMFYRSDDNILKSYNDKIFSKKIIKLKNYVNKTRDLMRDFSLPSYSFNIFFAKIFVSLRESRVASDT